MTEIRKYVRNRKGQRVGLLVADKVNGNVLFGWSKCSNNDRWNPKTAYTIAKGRLDARKGLERLPNSMEEAASYFKSRAERYFGRD